MRKARTFWIGALAAVLFAVATASPAFAGKADNSVRFAFEQTLDNIDPYFTIGFVTALVAGNIFDTLIYRDPETGAYEGNLATAWRLIDERTLELELRQGVKFHDGAEFDADDVVFTLNFVTAPKNRALNVAVTGWIDRVEKLDRYKVRIITRQTFPTAIAFLSSPYMAIYPHDYYARVGPAGMNLRPIGSGAFRVKEHARGKYIRLERNRDYFKGGPKGQPRLDNVEISFIPDAQTRVAEVVAGGLDLIMYVEPDQANQLRGLPGLQIVSGETVRHAFLQMNSTPPTPAPPLRDVRVRRAIMHAIDREAMVKYLMGENARVLHTECHPMQFGCIDARVQRYDYDPQLARRLLADAGYAKGFDIDLYAFRGRNQAEAIIGYLDAIGIRTRLRFMQQAAVVSARRSGRTSLQILPDSSFGIFDVSNAVSRFHNFSFDDTNRDEEVRDILKRGDFSLDPEVRKEAYATAFALIAERAQVLPLYSVPNYYAAAEGLVFKPYADEYVRFYEMSWK